VSRPYEHPLALVSPHMSGQRVKDAQWLLAGHSRFDGLATYKDGKIDGEYGPLTAQAARRAKYWLGYPANGVDYRFGQTLFEYLRRERWRPLPDAYHERRAQRLAQAEEQAQPGLQAFRVAETQLGYHETGHNCTKYGQWYRFDCVAWCAIFVSWCIAESGRKRPFRYSYVGNVYDDARWGRAGLSVVRTPRRGDLALYAPHKHISFFDHDLGGGVFQDLGGNTSDGVGWSNGGEVARTIRRYSTVEAFVRVGP
jgi:hypothetical protein